MASLLYTKSNPMASFLSKSKFLIQRRGCAAASHGPQIPKLDTTVLPIVNGMKEESGLGSSSGWAPDHETGYYKAANRSNSVELLEMLLKHRTK